jgi:DNA invertase Pin-like site-specific DNA recombinase
MSKELRRCAVYTRKSSDEGLDQAFNSLDAQREAGEAYVKSQASEGWRALPTRYDDGGYSGGSMERPALQRLLADIARGQVDVVVVYKIDRLTRSLADFARMVELFDRHGVSFVSVTQAFNTTSSMGRLTLNVLLSFAQFEREVTGERIRDKIAASKARGMWMGGLPPLGYDPPDDPSRTLRVNAAEADTVRQIFTRYLELGSVHELERWLHAQNIRSKRHVIRTGRVMGDLPFSRGALFHLLRNRIYRGEIVHKDIAHPGNHEAIVDEALFDAVQAQLDRSAVRRGHKAVSERAPLVGRIVDADDRPMSPTTSVGARGRSYRYYVSTGVQCGRGQMQDTSIRRVPAVKTEALLRDVIRRVAPQVTEPLDLLMRVQVRADRIELMLRGVSLADVRRAVTDGQVERDHDEAGQLRLTLPITLRWRGGLAAIHLAGDEARPDQVMIRALRHAHVMIDRDGRGLPLLDVAPATPYLRRIVRLALLAPDIQSAILDGRQPVELTLERLTRAEIPLGWEQQRQIFGFATA